MRYFYVLLAIMGGFLSIQARGQDLTTRCPLPHEITVESIPTSMNAFYSATVEGVSWTGYDINLGEPFKLPFLQAAITPSLTTQGQSIITCSYHETGMTISLNAGSIGNQTIGSVYFVKTPNVNTCAQNNPNECRFVIKPRSGS